ncbi:MAG: hypothetical protein KME26_22920 [Oscillatoria princeps RMCB-10]|nr:hypothetical protein [Oscillatoria princeps RMCB-10]
MRVKTQSLAKTIWSVPVAAALAMSGLLVPKLGEAQAASEFRIHCMSRLMYAVDRRRSEITEMAANSACQNAATAEQSVAVSDCVKETMYNSSNRLRDGMTAGAAAQVCQRATTKTLSQQISKCMREVMYDERSRLRQGMTAQEAVRQCG